MDQEKGSYTWRDYCSQDDEQIIEMTRKEMENHVLAQGFRWPNFLEQMFLPHLHDNAIIRILESENKLIGHYWLFDMKKTERLFGQNQAVFLNSVVVAQAEQRKGWGSLLLAAAIEHARELGGKVLLGHVQRTNENSYKFFVIKHGFSVKKEDATGWMIMKVI